ncbi:toll/interleukin-1 receptor domain-containing protein, partial [Salmonella enterica]|nr:toll/interleukin-1 receptor domain-containing protein [Salmonella enterica]
ANWFLFLATENSMSSRWCPWEIGYADGKKNLNNIVIVPTVDSSGRHHGNEYLQLYSRIDTTPNGALALTMLH